LAAAIAVRLRRWRAARWEGWPVAGLITSMVIAGHQCAADQQLEIRHLLSPALVARLCP
jgi:hypothetical protein